MLVLKLVAISRDFTLVAGLQMSEDDHGASVLEALTWPLTSIRC